MAETIALPARLDLTAASGLAADLQKRIGPDTVVLDASEVTHFGALCAQVILSAASALKAVNGQLDIVNVSERASANLAMMGLDVDHLKGGVQ